MPLLRCVMPLAAALLFLAAAPATRPAPHLTTTHLTTTHLTTTHLTTIEGAPTSLTLRTPAIYIFMNTECPISNKLIPELNRLSALAKSKNIAFFGVLSDPSVSRPDAIKHAADYHIAFPMLFDASGLLAADLQPAVTPHAFLLGAKGDPLYQGRISDAYASVGTPKAAPPSNDLEAALLAVASGKLPATASTKPIGCLFESWKRPASVGGGVQGSDKPAITYTRDIAPLLAANCISCHHAGEVAPFPLTSYSDAAKRADMLAQVTQDRLMPPWKSANAPGTFHDERRLSPAEIALFQAWAKANAPEGPAADAPPAPAFSDKWHLGAPDLLVKMPKPFPIPAAGKDLFAYTVIPLNLPSDQYVVAFEYRPGNRKVVHHMIAFLDNNGAAQKLAKDKGDGTTYLSFGGPGFLPSGGIGGWAPGATPRFLPDGVGRPVKKGADLVLNLHYHPSGKPETDQGEIALYFAKKPISKVAINFPLANRAINIPPGDDNYTRTASITAPVDVTLLGITPHMHMIGREMRVTATLPDGTSLPLINIPDWDWNWQDQYQFASPLKLPRGTKIDLFARYDNSKDNPRNPQSPPKRITFGEQTTNEMCIAFLQLTVDGLRAPLLNTTPDPTDKPPTTAQQLRDRWKQLRP